MEGTRVLNSYTLDVSMLTVAHFRSSTKVLWGEYWNVLWGNFTSKTSCVFTQHSHKLRSVYWTLVGDTDGNCHDFKYIPLLLGTASLIVTALEL